MYNLVVKSLTSTPVLRSTGIDVNIKSVDHTGLVIFLSLSWSVWSRDHTNPRLAVQARISIKRQHTDQESDKKITKPVW